LKTDSGQLWDNLADFTTSDLAYANIRDIRSSKIYKCNFYQHEQLDSIKKMNQDEKIKAANERNALRHQFNETKEGIFTKL